jgi:anti-sigma factor RsiW
MKHEALIHAHLEGEITPEEHAQLENTLRESWQARRLYLELADQHARLLQQPAVSTGMLLEAPAKRAPRLAHASCRRGGGAQLFMVVDAA